MKARRACWLGLADPAGQDKDAAHSAHVGGHVEHYYNY